MMHMSWWVKYWMWQVIKDGTLSMLIVQGVIHRANLIAKSIALKLHEILDSAIKYINSIKENAKLERLFK